MEEPTTAARAKRSARRLSEVTRHLIVPTGIVATGWGAVERRLREFGDRFDEWQRGIGQVSLSLRDDGTYAATVGGITMSIPRQVVKTFLVGRIVFAMCTIFPNLTVVWTAHHGRTVSKTFNGLKRYARRPAVRPYIAAIRSSGGEQEIHFTNESAIMFGARALGFGRGFEEVDVEVFDEAQILHEKALEDMVAATNQSRHPHGALLFFMGTPPRPTDPGEAFKLRRRRALGDREADAPVDEVYIEMSGDKSRDPDDPEHWAIANPSFPDHTPLNSMLRLRTNLPSLASWWREGLGVWDEDAAGTRAINGDTWFDRGVTAPPAAGVKSFGVAFSRDGTQLALAGGLKHEGGVHAELIDKFEGDAKVPDSVDDGLAALADWLAARWRDVATIVLAGKAGAPTLASMLRDRGVPERVVHVATTQEYFAACQMLLTAVGDESMTHLAAEGQTQLDLSVAVSDKQFRGPDGSWGWAPTVPDGDATPIEAISLALWGARTSKRRPRGDDEQKALVL